MADRQHIDMTVCGSFGFGNAGDEAVPLALHDLAASLGVDLNVAVVGRYAEVDLPDVIALGPKDEPRRRALRGRPILFAGGGIIEPRGQCVLLRGQQLLRELTPQRAAMFAAAVEPRTAFPWRIRRRVRRALRKLDHCSVRDVLSAESLRSLSRRSNAPVIGDLVLWMDAARESPGCVDGKDKYIAVNLANRWGDSPALLTWLTEHLARIAREIDAAIVFVPCSVKFDDDGMVHHRVVAALREVDSSLRVHVVDRALAPRELAAVLRDAQLTIGMRLHACVISYAQRTPCVGLVYHPKLIGFARTAGIEQHFLPAAIPERQSEDHHGYRLADLDLTQSDLTSTALEAIDATSFNHLPNLRASLRKKFAEFMDVPLSPSAPNAAIRQEVAA